MVLIIFVVIYRVIRVYNVFFYFCNNFVVKMIILFKMKKYVLIGLFFYLVSIIDMILRLFVEVLNFSVKLMLIVEMIFLNMVFRRILCDSFIFGRIFIKMDVSVMFNMLYMVNDLLIFSYFNILMGMFKRNMRIFVEI